MISVRRTIFFFTGMVLCFNAMAEVDVVATDAKKIMFQGLTNQEASEAALKWGLTEKEWREYEAIMLGKRGMWSPGIDPITALGVHAESQSERNHYADLYVKAAFTRVEGELAFQRAVDAAWKRNFPNISRIVSYKRSIAGEPIVRYGIVVKSRCAECSKVVHEHITLLKKSVLLKGVDIFVADSGGKDALLRQWTENAQVEISDIREGAVTINHGHAYADFGHFPKVFAKELSGRWLEQ